jgi:peptidoglycan/LPS O-acetylase OafA/YrhL
MLFALLFGCAIATYEKERGLPSFHKLAPRFLIGILIAVVLVTQTLSPERSDLWLAPAASLTSVLLVAAARTAEDSVLAARPLTWLGVVSYSWYRTRELARLSRPLA